MLKSAKGIAKGLTYRVLCTGRKKEGSVETTFTEEVKTAARMVTEAATRKTLGGGTAGQTHACQDIPYNFMKRNYEIIKVNFKE